MSIDFKDRTLYLRLSLDEDGKKKGYFGGHWGAMDKADANAVAFKTGDGLVVVDIDVKKMKKLDPEFVKALGDSEVTVETARGFHYYFEDERSAEFTNKASYTKHVDVRSDGGIIYAQYKGKEKSISYKKVGKVNGKMPKALFKYLKKRMSISKKKVTNRIQWEKVPRGEIHDGCISYAMRDFKMGLDHGDVVANGLEYVRKYLGDKPKEVTMMLDRIKWGYEKHLENKTEKMESAPAVVEPEDIGGELSDTEVLAMLKTAQERGAMELERTMKILKKKLKLSLGTMKEMLKESPVEGSGLSELFKGDIIWDSALGCFVEITEFNVKYYAKNGFTQTCISLSGWMGATDVNDKMHTIPHKHIEYDPTNKGGDMFDELGYPCINIHRPQNFGKVKKKYTKKVPKTIGKILDNLFATDPKAKEVFINWMAVVVQTGVLTGVAWGFFGASGSGKGFVADMMSELVGKHNASLNVGDVDLQSAFNAYAHHTQFVHLNEVAVDYHARHGVAGKLKPLISDPYLIINKKNMPTQTVRNFANVIMNSNKANPLEIDIDDRRWNLVVSDKPLIDLDWWVSGVSYNKGLSEVNAMGQYLMAYKIDMKMATTPMKMSKAKESVIAQTTAPLKMLGDLISKGDSEDLMDYLDLDATDLYFDKDELPYALKTGRWSNALLTKLYKWATGKDALRGGEVGKYFSLPHIKGESTTWSCDNKTVRGIIV